MFSIFRDNKLLIYQNKRHKLQLRKFKHFGSAFLNNIQKVYMFSIFETINYQYIRTNFILCSQGSSNFLVRLFQKIFRNCTCFPFSREKIINIFEKTLETVATVTRTFRFCCLKNIQKLHMFSFFARINYQYIRTNFKICSYRGSNVSVLLFQLIFKNYKYFLFREKEVSIYSNKLQKLQLQRLELFGSAFPKNIQKLHMFSFFERMNYQYIRTNFIKCSYGNLNFSVRLFQKIF